MNIATTILISALLVAVSSAQTAPASQVVKPNAPQTKVQTGPSSLQSPFVPKKPAKTAPAAKAPQPAHTPAAKPALVKKPVVAQKATVQNPVVAQKNMQKPEQKPVNKALHAAANKPKVKAKAKAQSAAIKPAVKSEARPAETAPAETQVAAAKPKPNPGKRDPFVSPIAAAALRNGTVANCTTGKRCLVVDQIALKGIVQMKEGNFALVENAARRPYVLRENDSLFNGSVVKITGDSVIFKENGSDILGRPTTKEVVKKVSAPAV